VEIDPVTRVAQPIYDATRSGLFNRNFWSDIVSGAQRLKGGNTLICSGVRGRLFEVTRAGDIVWEYMSPYANPTFQGPVTTRIYRAYRLPFRWWYFPSSPQAFE
jgi:hypothetical protein